MGEKQEALRALLQEYAQRPEFGPRWRTRLWHEWRRLGCGHPKRKAINPWQRPPSRHVTANPEYCRERDVYVRLKEKQLILIRACEIPQLLGYDDDLWIIQMTIVSRPFCLDFRRSAPTSEKPPDFLGKKVMADWQAEEDRAIRQTLAGSASDYRSSGSPRHLPVGRASKEHFVRRLNWWRRPRTPGSPHQSLRAPTQAAASWCKRISASPITASALALLRLSSLSRRFSVSEVAFADWRCARRCRRNRLASTDRPLPCRRPTPPWPHPSFYLNRRDRASASFDRKTRGPACVCRS